MTRKLCCARCRRPLDPVYPGQCEHPRCSPGVTGWIPRPAAARHAELPDVETGNLRIALKLAAAGQYILPLAPATKRPLGNCTGCRDTPAGLQPHPLEACPCLPAGRWCHGVRAATTDPARLTSWWAAEPAAVPAVAAGPSGLVLVDIDAHADELPPVLATGLLPGIDLAAENVPRCRWDDPRRFRDGRDTLRLLAELRGGPETWPADPARQPVAVTTPSAGRHLWYQAPADGLRQALSDTRGRYGLAWQVDIKAGWSYGIAPGTVTAAGTYQIAGGDPGQPGRMPGWLAREIIRVAAPRAAPPPAPAVAGRPGPAARRYLDTVINRGADRLALLDDGRKRALAALAYQTGGLLAWSGHSEDEVIERLTTAGTATGMPAGQARRIVTRSLANGLKRPLTPEPTVTANARPAGARQ